MKIYEVFDEMFLISFVVILCIWGISYIGFSMAGDTEGALEILKYLPYLCFNICFINLIRLYTCKKQ